MIEVIGVNLNNTLEKSKFERFMSYTSTEKCERIIIFHRYEDALRTLIGDINFINVNELNEEVLLL